MQKSDSLLSLFGLARRCGKIAQGFDAATAAVSRRKARAFFLTPDAAERTRRNVRRIAEENGAQVFELAVAMQELGACMGCGPTGVVALMDAGFEKKACTLASNGFCERDGQ